MADSVSTGRAPSELFKGAYYSIINGDVFSIAKVLKLEQEIVHVRIYKQHFQQRPRSIDPAALTLGTIHDKDGFGMGHLPLRLATFMESDPIFLTHVELKPEELEGYNLWIESPGGVSGNNVCHSPAARIKRKTREIARSIGFYLQRLKLFRN